jgi:hypothetical protein
MTSDRRKREERREAMRYEVALDIEWEGRNGRENGVLGDLSNMGCFVLGSGDVEDGDEVKIYIPVSDGMRIEFSGEVVNHVLEIGFGMKFVGLNSAQEELITRMIESTPRS